MLFRSHVGLYAGASAFACVQASCKALQHGKFDGLWRDFVQRQFAAASQSNWFEGCATWKQRYRANCALDANWLNVNYTMREVAFEAKDDESLGPCCALACCGDRLAAAFVDAVVLLDMASGKQLHRLSTRSECLAFPQPNRLLIANYTVAKLWDLDADGAPSLLREFRGHDGEICAMAVRSDRKLVISASLDNTVRVWNLESGQCVRVLRGHSDSLIAVDVDVGGGRVFSSDWNNRLLVSDLATGEVRNRVQLSSPAESLCFHADSQRLSLDDSRSASVFLRSLMNCCSGQMLSWTEAEGITEHNVGTFVSLMTIRRNHLVVMSPFSVHLVQPGSYKQLATLWVAPKPSQSQTTGASESTVVRTSTASFACNDRFLVVITHPANRLYICDFLLGAS